MPGSCRRYGRGGTDTEDDAAYMGETDPFVCRRIAYAPGPGDGAAPWGMRFGRTRAATGPGNALLHHTPVRVAHHLADPGEPWRIVARLVTGPLLSSQPRNLGA
ncbi:hypothetical protein GCM10009579_77480 [Streptomyces javensis]|uniref:Uncharacterized protein n=1 Tax=Streptomyces javensis TaxID=114698 RepID=A0ABP4I4K0_9ACTN